MKFLVVPLALQKICMSSGCRGECVAECKSQCWTKIFKFKKVYS